MFFVVAYKKRIFLRYFKTAAGKTFNKLQLVFKQNAIFLSRLLTINEDIL